MPSVVELGLIRVYRAKPTAGLAEKGDCERTLAGVGCHHHHQQENEQTRTLTAGDAPRLFPEMPPAKYVCFYPMDRRRGEHKNWYQLPLAERQRQMNEHGMIGRRYAGTVRQIITGSIGFDD